MKYHYQEGIIIPFAQKYYRQLILAVAAIFMASFAMMSLMASAATTTQVVTGNTVTSPVENGSEGWWFNRDTNTDTPYKFINGNASIGSGSLYVEPIGANAADKFIAEYFVFDQMGEVESFSYDFKIGTGGDATDEEQFYLNVYANFNQSGPTKFYDCRYNIVPTIGSTAGYTTVTFDVDSAYPVTQRTGAEASPETCPAVPADMGDDAYIRVFAINLGDGSTSDLGLDGYFDRVVYTTLTDTTTFDFERAQNTGEITSPTAGSTVSGNVMLSASYEDNTPGDVDGVQWALRSGTCAAGTGTVAGNVDGENDPYTWTDSANFSATIDTTNFADGSYCFVFNPTDDAGENNVRLTREFIIDNPQVLGAKDECKNGGWVNATAEGYSGTFKNQGHCVSHFASNGNSTAARNR